MAATGSRPELLAIVGPTASGKSALAMMIATTKGGEIIAADSRTVYRGMDIGTAKPNEGEQAVVPHWGLDLVEPGETYSVHDFKTYANLAIADIQSRGKLPILVGGTGLYVDAILFDFRFSPDGAKRDSQNPRHLVKSNRPLDKKIIPDTLIIGLMPDNYTLKKSIDGRAEQVFKKGVVKETEKLVRRYGESAVFSTGGIVYRICLKLLNGQISRAEAVAKFKIADWKYARRQKTWFKRNRYIKWFDSAEGAYQYLNNNNEL